MFEGIKKALENREQEKRKATEELIARRKAAIPLIEKLAKEHNATVEFFDTEAHVSRGEKTVYIPYGTSEDDINYKLESGLTTFKSARKEKIFGTFRNIADKLEEVEDGYKNLDKDIKAASSKKAVGGFWDKQPVLGSSLPSSLNTLPQPQKPKRKKDDWL